MTYEITPLLSDNRVSRWPTVLHVFTSGAGLIYFAIPDLEDSEVDQIWQSMKYMCMDSSASGPIKPGGAMR